MHVNDAEAGIASARLENDFDFLSPEYEDLFRRSGATAFQRPLWLHSLYTILAPRLGAKPHIVAVRRDRSGELLMLIPMIIQKTFAVSILQPADLGVCDYNSLIAEPDTLAALPGNAALLRQVRGYLDAGDVLIFRKIQHSPAALAAILGHGEQRPCDNSGFEVELFANRFEDWRKAKLKKDFRNGTSRRLRKLKADHGSVDFVTFTQAADIDKAIRFIGTLRTKRFRDDILKNDAYLDFYLHYALAGAASGEAVTSGLIVDGVLVSADFGIVNSGAYHSILCAALLAEYGQYAPGLQALSALIEERSRIGEVRFDFGIGKSRQKTDFAATEIPLYNLTIPRSVSGHVVSLVYNRAGPLKTTLRNLVGWVR